MGAINQEFNLQINQTPLDNFVRQVERATVATDAQVGACERLTRSTEQMSRVVASPAIDQWLKSGQTWEQHFGKAEAAAEKAVVSQERVAQVAEKSWFQQELAAQKAYWAAQKAESGQAKLAKSTQKTESMAQRAVNAFMGFSRAQNPIDALTNRITRTVVTLFSVRKVLGYITDAMERAPDKIGGSFTALGNTVKDSFARIIVSLMGGMQSGVEKLNKALNSKAGQTLFRGLERAAQLAGNAIGKLLEIGATLVEFLGNHAQEAFTLVAIAAAFFAAQMLLSAAASAAAAWPLILIVGLAAALVVGLMKAGVTAEEIFEKIGQGAGWLYALVYNIVADVYNLFATFAEFFANVFNDPVAAVAHLFFDTFDVILSMIETVAKGIDLLTGKSLASGIAGFRSDLQSWVNETYGENEIKIQRMDKISYLDTAYAWGNKASDIANSFSLDSLGQLTSPDIKDIKSDTASIKKAVSLSQEDIKSLVDVMERRYVNNVNLTTLRPVITVNGSNTGRTAEDRQAIADAIQEILIEQTASGSYVATAMP